MMPHFVYVRSCRFFIRTHTNGLRFSRPHTQAQTGVFRYGYTHSNPLRPPIHPLSRGLTCHYAATSHVFPYTRAVWAGLCSSELVICGGLFRYVLWRQSASVYVYDLNSLLYTNFRLFTHAVSVILV